MDSVFFEVFLVIFLRKYKNYAAKKLRLFDAACAGTNKAADK